MSLLPFFIFFFFPSSISATEFILHCVPPRRLPLPPLTLDHHAQDCLYILAHLPTDPSFPRGNQNLHSFSPLGVHHFSTSLPFLPRVHIHHGSCELQLNWVLDASRKSPFWNHRNTESWNSNFPVMDKWGLGAYVGVELLARCVRGGMTGVGVASIDWVQVQVLFGGLDRRATWERRQNAPKNFLARREAPYEDEFGQAIHDKWSYGVYEV